MRRKTSSKELKDKITGDLEKAKAPLATVLKEWIFVHNDADGLNSDEVVTTLAGVRAANKAVVVGEHIAFEELWTLVRELTFERICDVLPCPPSIAD